MLDDALAAGHEGVVVKALDAPYAAGRRGKAWQKVKPVHTLDLVVLGAEWGYGRRTGSLSNIHLGARDPDGGEPIMVGKTFKGMTDELLAWQTATFPGLAREERRTTRCCCGPSWSSRSRWTAPSAAPATPAASRCASPACVRYRPDKTPAEADTIDAVRALARLREYDFLAPCASSTARPRSTTSPTTTCSSSPAARRWPPGSTSTSPARTAPARPCPWSPRT